MEKYNPDIHHRRSIRLPEYDYSREGLYFITICTHNRECFFGEIVNGTMQLSHIGIIADVFWHEIKNHTQNIELHEFIVMPNHVHGIIEILPHDCRGNACVAPTGTERFQNQGKNTISSIVGSYKSVVSKHAHRLGFDFAWQRNYFENIIRNQKSYLEISDYIIDNPAKWEQDKFFTTNNLE